MSTENGCENCLKRFICPSPCFKKKQEEWITNCSEWETQDVKWQVVRDWENNENES